MQLYGYCKQLNTGCARLIEDLGDCIKIKEKTSHSNEINKY